MRALPVSLLLLSLTGCSGLHHAPSAVQSGPKNPFKDTTAAVHKAAPRSAPLPAKLYKDPKELVGKPFRDLGEVYGSTCKVSLQDRSAAEHQHRASQYADPRRRDERQRRLAASVPDRERRRRLLSAGHLPGDRA